MPSKQQQADSEIHEDQLLNFLVNRLDEEVPLSLANNAEITAEDLCLDALCFEPEHTRCEHDPLPPSDEVRAGSARTSR